MKNKVQRWIVSNSGELKAYMNNRFDNSRPAVISISDLKSDPRGYNIDDICSIYNVHPVAAGSTLALIPNANYMRPKFDMIRRHYSVGVAPFGTLYIDTLNLTIIKLVESGIFTCQLDMHDTHMVRIAFHMLNQYRLVDKNGGRCFSMAEAINRCSYLIDSIVDRLVRNKANMLHAYLKGTASFGYTDYDRQAIAIIKSVIDIDDRLLDKVLAKTKAPLTMSFLESLHHSDFKECVLLEMFKVGNKDWLDKSTSYEFTKSGRTITETLPNRVLLPYVISDICKYPYKTLIMSQKANWAKKLIDDIILVTSIDPVKYPSRPLDDLLRLLKNAKGNLHD